MPKQKIGIVAYDDVTNTKNKYLRAFKSYYADSEYDFVVAWSSTEELISFIRDQGIATINELSRILVFDNAFPNQLDVTDIVNTFVSLEEIMENRKAITPLLSFVTTNQEVYDMFKKELSPEGHELFVYPKTRIHRIKADKNGSFNMGSLNRVIEGYEDQNALAIRNDYEGRETLARREAENFKNNKLNGKAAQIEKIVDSFNQKDEYKKVSHQVNNNKELIDNLKKKAAAEANNEKVEDKNKPSKKSLAEEDAKLHAKERNQKSQSSVETRNNDLKDEISKATRLLREKSVGLNYDAKIYNDKGTIIIGGLPGSGVSSITANLAMLYAMIDKQVLIVNFSSNDHIINYFKDFKDMYKELGRENVLITKFARKLKELAVPVFKNINIISDYGITQKAYDIKERLQNYDKIMRMSSQYDITLILAGDNYEDVLLSTNQEYLDDIILVSTQDELPELQLDLIENLKRYNIKLRHINHSIGLIINKIQYYQSNKDLENNILKLNQPLDKMRLIGSIGYNNEWFTQIKSGYPLIARSNLVQTEFKEIAKNIIMRDA